MRFLAAAFATSLLGGTLLSCQHDGETPAPATPHCAGAGPLVKSVVEKQGTVAYDQSQGQYLILVPQGTGFTTGAVDAGILCDSLPGNLRRSGQRVVFSGSYWQKTTGGTSGDITTYYLTLSKIALL